MSARSPGYPSRVRLAVSPPVGVATGKLTRSLELTGAGHLFAG